MSELSWWGWEEGRKGDAPSGVFISAWRGSRRGFLPEGWGRRFWGKVGGMVSSQGQ